MFVTWNFFRNNFFVGFIDFVPTFVSFFFQFYRWNVFLLFLEVHSVLILLYRKWCEAQLRLCVENIPFLSKNFFRKNMLIMPTFLQLAGCTVYVLDL